MNMNFGANKTPVEIMKVGTFGGTYFRVIYSGKWYRKSWKEFAELNNIDQNYYCWNDYDVKINKYKINCGTPLQFWENNSWINSLDPYRWFQWHFRHFLDRGSSDDKRQIARWKGIVSRFKGKLVKMIKYVNGRFNDYNIAPKIRRILLHSDYELVGDDLLWFLFLFIKNGVTTFFNRQELLQKAK